MGRYSILSPTLEDWPYKPVQNRKSFTIRNSIFNTSNHALENNIERNITEDPEVNFEIDILLF